MELEKQVTSFKLSKKLKELGVKQESLWVWAKDTQYFNKDGNYKYELFSTQVEEDREFLHGEGGKQYSAFTVAELGERLPKEIYTVKTDKDWYCWSDEDSDDPDLQTIDPIHGDTEANARAKMLIYLRENKLIKKEVSRG